jgi:hypothetical protein
MTTRKFGATATALSLITAAATFAIASGPARANGAPGGGGVTPQAIGNQQISSGPGVYAQTTNEYATSWAWSQVSASYDYYWYIFQSNGTLTASGHRASGGGDSRTVPGNIYYFKEYNNEPTGSGRINVLSVDYCC